MRPEEHGRLGAATLSPASPRPPPLPPVHPPFPPCPSPASSPASGVALAGCRSAIEDLIGPALHLRTYRTGPPLRTYRAGSPSRTYRTGSAFKRGPVTMGPAFRRYHSAPFAHTGAFVARVIVWQKKTLLASANFKIGLASSEHLCYCLCLCRMCCPAIWQ